MEKKIFQEELSEMKKELQQMYESLNIADKETELIEIEQKISLSNFWENQKNAQKVIGRQKQLKEAVDVWRTLNEKINDIEILNEMLEDEFDEATYQEMLAEFEKVRHEHENFLLQIMFSDEHDHSNAYLEIRPGEGGVDAQDFAQILYRMYLRWCEQNHLQAEVLEYQSGDEAGLKNVTVYIKGKNAFGKLKSESGIHRLIRLSPFDTAKRRHTSFASVSVIPEVDQTIDLQIEESDLKIDTYRSSGAGGQSVNTTDSAVRITHIPTGIVVTCQNERSQIQNKEQAMKILYAKLYEFEEQKRLNEQNVLIGEKKGIGFGNQIRSYVFHPYNMVKDHRTNYEVGNVNDVIDGNINGFIENYLKYLTKKN